MEPIFFLFFFLFLIFLFSYFLIFSYTYIDRVQPIAKLDHFVMFHLVNVKPQMRVLLTMAQLSILMSVFVHVVLMIAMLHRGCIVMQQLVLVSRNHVYPENIGKFLVVVANQ